MTKQKSIEHLDDSVSMKIRCTKCDDIEEQFFGASLDFSEFLYNLGWRGTENNIYCPVCAITFKLK